MHSVPEQSVEASLIPATTTLPDVATRMSLSSTRAPVKSIQGLLAKNSLIHMIIDMISLVVIVSAIPVWQSLTLILFMTIL